MFAILATQNCSGSVSRPYLNRGLDYRGEAAGSQTQMGSEPKFKRQDSTGTWRGSQRAR
jgi:hypothetical protein